MEQTECSETSAYKFRRREITQKKQYNIHNTEKVWNQEYLALLPSRQLHPSARVHYSTFRKK